MSLPSDKGPSDKGDTAGLSAGHQAALPLIIRLGLATLGLL